MCSSDSTRPPNVLVIVADTARADDAYSVDPPVMPTLSSFGADGTTFRNAFASAPWTLPSHAGLFTGTYSTEHGAHGAHPRLRSDMRTMAEAFRDAGYETFAASNNTWISPEFGFDRGFERFWKGWQLVQSTDDVGSIVHEIGPVRRARSAVRSVFRGNPVVNTVNACYNKWSDYGAERTTTRLQHWITSRSDDRPFFAFVNYLEPHIQYRPPRAYAVPFLPADASYEEARAVRQDPRAYDVGAYELSTREFELLRALYRGELAHVDAQLDALRHALRRADEWQRTIVVVLGDHGENIGDHGFLGHQYNLFDTLLHVPLVMVGGPFSDGETVDHLVQLPDVAPTLLDVAGIEDDPLINQSRGWSLHPNDPSAREFAVAEYMAPQPPTDVLTERYGPLPPHAETFDRRLRAIRTPRRKLVRGSGGSIRYFELDPDPEERIDRSSESPEQVESLTLELDGWIDRLDALTTRDDVSMSRGAERRLADLGYL